MAMAAPISRQGSVRGGTLGRLPLSGLAQEEETTTDYDDDASRDLFFLISIIGRSHCHGC